MSTVSPLPEVVKLSSRVTPLNSKRLPRNVVDDPSRDSVVHLHHRSAAAKVQGIKWKRAHHRRLLVLDTVIIAAVVVMAEVLRRSLLDPPEGSAAVSLSSALVPAVLVLAWVIVLEVQRSRDVSLVGIGVEEYRRVFSATVWVFGALAVSTLLFKVEMSRAFLAIALPLGLVGLLGGRHCARKYLARKRTQGQYITRVLVLGKPDAVVLLAECFDRSPDAGYRAVGACVPDYDGDDAEELVTAAGFVPILGDDASVMKALRLTNADALAVAAAGHLGHKKMQKLLWQLEALGTELIVVPGMTDVASPRLLMRPLDNLPLFHIAAPRKAGPSAAAKRAFDLVLGIAALLAALPLLVSAAVMIKLDDGGPVIFRQVRVGHQGSLFRIFKLRTMSANAKGPRDAQPSSAGGSGVFYKSASDDRITQVGKILRATSIDELPQLFNVLAGSMSIVGPRPLVPGEGESVEDFVERRGLVKPGMTGLWQISGRSDLSEAERIRLDHSYVDNWSCVLDLMIVWRTVRAVLRRQGAY